MKVFSLFDVEGKSKITLRDLKRVAKELGETMTGAWCSHRRHQRRGAPCCTFHRRGDLAVAVSEELWMFGILLNPQGFYRYSRCCLVHVSHVQRRSCSK